MSDEGARPGAEAGNLAYVPFAQWPGRPASVVVRAATPEHARALVAGLPGIASAALADEPLEHPRTIDDDVRARFRPWSLIAATLAALAAFAVVVAAVGVYGVVAYNAARRTREIGIRVTLGASRRDVIALFGGQAARLAAGGAALGLAASAASTRVIRGMLFGTDPLDPAVLLAVTALLALVTLAAGCLPARRAARIDPTVALRTD